MSGSQDLRRLLDDDGSDLVRGALRAERDEAIDSERLERIGRAIALAAIGPPPRPPPVDPKPAGALGAKGAASLAAVVAIGGVVALVVTREEAPAPPPPAERIESVVAAPPLPEPLEPPTARPADLPSAPLPAPVAKPRASQRPAAESDEIALLARAHDALAADPKRSLALCREHEARFSGGHFAQEREAVAIEALVYLGRTDEAHRRWEEFRRKYPASTHRVHLETLLSAHGVAP